MASCSTYSEHRIVTLFFYVLVTARRDSKHLGLISQSFPLQHETFVGKENLREVNYSVNVQKSEKVEKMASPVDDTLSKKMSSLLLNADLKIGRLTC